MSHPNFATVPFGLDGLHAVQRTHDGKVAYLACRLDPSKIAGYSLGLAEATCKVLRGQAASPERAWLPWHTDHLDSKKPMSMYPPSRQPSPYCTLGRA